MKVEVKLFIRRLIGVPEGVKSVKASIIRGGRATQLQTSDVQGGKKSKAPDIVGKSAAIKRHTVVEPRKSIFAGCAFWHEAIHFSCTVYRDPVHASICESKVNMKSQVFAAINTSHEARHTFTRLV